MSIVIRLSSRHRRSRNRGPGTGEDWHMADDDEMYDPLREHLRQHGMDDDEVEPAIDVARRHVQHDSRRRMNGKDRLPLRGGRFDRARFSRDEDSNGPIRATVDHGLDAQESFEKRWPEIARIGHEPEARDLRSSSPSCIGCEARNDPGAEGASVPPLPRDAAPRCSVRRYMSTALEKKRPEPSISAGRAELAAAIVHRREAEAIYERQREAVARVEAEIGQCDVERAKDEAALAKKRHEDVSRAATAIRNETKVISAWAEDAVHRSIEAVKNRRQLLIQAAEQLKADLVKFAIDVASAKNVAIVAATKVAAPLYAARITRIRELRLELLKERVALATFMIDITVEFPHDAQAFFAAREAEAARIKAREAACGAFAREAETDAAYLAVMPASHSMEEYQTVMEVAEQWKSVFARLLDDANAELPESK